MAYDGSGARHVIDGEGKHFAICVFFNDWHATPDAIEETFRGHLAKRNR
jgi:hypothetical protein